MANVVILAPLHTYPTQPNSSEPVAFQVLAAADVPGQIVSFDADGIPLGSAAAGTTPISSGPYAAQFPAYGAWYLAQIAVSTWLPTWSLAVPGLSATAGSGSVALLGTVAVPGIAASSGAAAVGIGLQVPAQGATSGAGAVALQGLLLAPPIAASSGMASVYPFPALAIPGMASSSGAGAVALRGLIAAPGMAATGSAGSVAIVSDTIAPSVGTLTVTPGTGTACTFSDTITDAVGVTKWLLVEGASDPGATDPGQTGATTVASTTSLTLTSQAFTSTATATGTRYWRLHAWDAAGNHGVSAVASATVTISGGTTVWSDAFASNTIASYTQTGATFVVSGGKLSCSDVAHTQDLAVCVRTTGTATDGWVQGDVSFDAGFISDCIAGGAQSGSTGLVIRWGSATNYIRAFIDAGTGDLLCYQTVSGVQTQISTAYHIGAISAGTAYTIKLAVSGSSVTVYLNGTSRITGTTTRTASGQAGATDGRLGAIYDAGTDSYLYPAGNVYFDSLSLTTP